MEVAYFARYRYTLGPPPGDATHWTGRMLAKAAGVSLRSVQRLLEAHQLVEWIPEGRNRGDARPGSEIQAARVALPCELDRAVVVRQGVVEGLIGEDGEIGGGLSDALDRNDERNLGPKFPVDVH